MKRKLLPFIVLFSAIFLFDSCLNDNDNGVVYYNDTAITAFTPGTLNQYLHTKTASGKDSVYKKTLTGSKFPFYIDQMKNEIYNPDSLPYGTDAKHVICTITSKNSGVIALKSMTSDSMSATEPRNIGFFRIGKRSAIECTDTHSRRIFPSGSRTAVARDFGPRIMTPSITACPPTFAFSILPS